MKSVLVILSSLVSAEFDFHLRDLVHPKCDITATINSSCADAKAKAVKLLMNDEQPRS